MRHVRYRWRSTTTPGTTPRTRGDRTTVSCTIISWPPTASTSYTKRVGRVSIAIASIQHRYRITKVVTLATYT